MFGWKDLRGGKDWVGLRTFWDAGAGECDEEVEDVVERIEIPNAHRERHGVVFRRNGRGKVSCGVGFEQECDLGAERRGFDMVM